MRFQLKQSAGYVHITFGARPGLDKREAEWIAQRLGL